MAKPVITTDIVGCREVVEHGVNGLLVPLRDVGSLADAMRYLAANADARRRMGAAGRDKMVREFDESIVISRVLAIYGLGAQEKQDLKAVEGACIKEAT